MRFRLTSSPIMLIITTIGKGVIACICVVTTQVAQGWLRPTDCPQDTKAGPRAGSAVFGLTGRVQILCREEKSVFYLGVLGGPSRKRP